ncbi:hypothetical protein ERO13_A09G189000v2 [Gossypium hirsutum]|uniref:Uncharacterized protein n=1 Tax=Gossypium mustelinum TaxID=34275 RepID=A0A5D2Y0E9_GOSMU|nr:hypothetical protein ERO13_A09G189000v2 [Gossypium hirsutum]TYJ19582.1 hypothetical protein E1A91_A09G201100v1 [Gossypium mustelinum]
MGSYAKTMILLFLLVCLQSFISGNKGSDYAANSATNEGMIQVQMRKLILNVDIQRDYSPVTSNPKHEPGPPRGKSGTASTAGGGR